MSCYSSFVSMQLNCFKYSHVILIILFLIRLTGTTNPDQSGPGSNVNEGWMDGWIFWFHSISSTAGYSMPNTVYTNIWYV